MRRLSSLQPDVRRSICCSVWLVAGLELVLTWEPFTNENLPDPNSSAPRTVPKGRVFVMGDNRGISQDSRAFGPLTKENIEGEDFLRFWPLGRIGLL